MPTENDKTEALLYAKTNNGFEPLYKLPGNNVTTARYIVIGIYPESERKPADIIWFCMTREEARRKAKIEAEAKREYSNIICLELRPLIMKDIMRRKEGPCSL